MKRKWPVYLVAFLIMALVCAFCARVWLSGTTGCAKILSTVQYDDPDEREQFAPEPTEPIHVFSDSAYDAAYPDLIEPTPDAVEPSSSKEIP